MDQEESVCRVEALLWASSNGHVEVVKLLLEAGADIHVNNDYALRMTSGNGCVETVKILLNAGADIHARDDEALRWASSNGHAEVVNLLQNHMKKFDKQV